MKSSLDAPEVPLIAVVAYPVLFLALWVLASNTFTGQFGWAVNNFTIGVTPLMIYPVARAMCSRYARWKVILASLPIAFRHLDHHFQDGVCKHDSPHGPCRRNK